MNPFFYKSKQRTGQIIIEAIIASSVLVVGLLGITALLASSFRMNRVVSDDYIATYLAAEGIEVVKNIIDHNLIIKANPWYSGLTCSGNTCNFEVDYGNTTPIPLFGTPRNILLSSANGFYGYASGSPTNFTRMITVTFPSQYWNGSTYYGINVRSRVEWSSGGFRSSVVLEDMFFDWRPKT